MKNTKNLLTIAIVAIIALFVSVNMSASQRQRPMIQPRTAPNRQQRPEPASNISINDLALGFKEVMLTLKDLDARVKALELK